jgi:hypothetical protein
LDTLADDSLADEAAEHADLLATDHHSFPAVEQLVGDDRGKAAEHVVARVHHDALGAHAGAGRPSRRYPCPYVPTRTYQQRSSKYFPRAIVSYFHLFEDLSKMKPTQVLSKIIAHDLSMKIGKEPSPSSQDVGTSNKEEKEMKIEDKQESSTSGKKAQEQVLGL